MDSDLNERLESLLKSGKITESEKEELEKAIFGEDYTENAENGKEKIKEVEIKNFLSGEITISAGDTFRIAEGKEYTNVEQMENKITLTPKVATKFPALSHLFAGYKEIAVEVPENASILINTVSADVSISRVSGRVSVRTISGDIEITRVHSLDLQISTVSGDITMNKINGIINIKAKSGDLSITDSKLHGNVKLYSGDVNIGNSKISGDVVIRTFSGDVALNGVKINYDTEISSFYGDIEVSLMNSEEIVVDAESRSGDVFSEKNVKEAAEAKTKYTLKVRTNKGDITIKNNQNAGGAQ